MKDRSKRNIEVNFISNLNREFEKAFYKILKDKKKLSLNLHSLEDELQKLPVHLIELTSIKQLILEHPLQFYFDPQIKVVVGKNITLEQEADLIRLGFSDAIDLEQISFKGIQRVITNSYFRKMYEKKNAELKEKIIHSTKLASLGLLTAGIAHELNNPLTILKGFAHRLARPHLSSDKKQEMAQKIIQVSDRIGKIVDGIRAHSQEKNYHHNEEFSPTEIFHQILTPLKPILKSKGISLILKNDIPPHLKMQGNQNKFESILHNLLSNALDALVKKKASDGSIKIYLKNTKEKLHITIEDNGIGIGKEDKDKIFDPFYTTKELGEGTGLGLGIVKEAVEIHQGALHIQSTPHEGTLVKLTFPLLKD